MNDEQRLLDARTVDFRFQWQDATVLSAHDGEEGLRPFDEHAPDVMVFDVGLPGDDRLRPGRDRPVRADRRARILLVEDDPLIRDLIAEVLEAESYAIVACETPVQATLLLQRVSFDLVITDGFSPVPGGVLASTAPVVRCADPTPVVLFSAHPINVTAAVAAGFRGVITKPFDLDTLIGQVTRCVEGSPRQDSEAQHVELRS
jgi:DNA-binding response OmpR family regulator